MKNIILSEKPYHSKLVQQIEREMPDLEWVWIQKRSDFIIDTLNSIQPEYIFIPHWSHIISNEIFENYVCIIFHMTDLPYGRGGSPLQNLISRGHTSTKITALKAVEELDAGPVYMKEDLPLHGNATEIFLRAANIIKDMILAISKNNPEPQEQSGEAVIFKRRTPDMSAIKNIESLEDLYNHIRMLDADGYPKAFLETDHFRLEFSRSSINSDKSILADVRIFKK